MKKFAIGFLTALLLVVIYLSSVNIPEFIIYYECQREIHPQKKPGII